MQTSFVMHRSNQRITTHTLQGKTQLSTLVPAPFLHHKGSGQTQVGPTKPNSEDIQTSKNMHSCEIRIEKVKALQKGSDDYREKLR